MESPNRFIPPTPPARGTSTGRAAAGAAPVPLVQFQAVSKRYGQLPAVEALTLDIYQGEFFALLGPSGCGKTTLLRLLAGFERPTAGRILLDGQDLGDMPPHRRPVNMMFQSYALFPHLTVERNIAFGLRQEGMAKSDIAPRVGELLALVRLERYAGRKPDQLSGGERQRVALARSLAKRPRVLLLDEPMAALDKKLRQDTQFELMELQARLGTTFLIVTHDQDEAMTVANRIAVMEHGRIVQVGPPVEVYEHPNSRYVADFIGEVNIIEGRLVATTPERTLVATDAGGRLATTPGVDLAPGAIVWVALRPEKLRITAEPPRQAPENLFVGTVGEIGYLGNMSIYKLRLDSGHVWKAALANTTRHADRPIVIGDRVWVSFDSDATIVLTR
jgi:putrescine transport system ATP-binding protein